MKPSAARVARRFQAALPELDEATARLQVTPWEEGAFRVYLRMNRVDDDDWWPFDAGWIMLRPESAHWKPSAVCAANIDKLVAKEFGGRRPKVWHVLQSEVISTLRGKGWGKKLYLRALQEVKPGIVVADDCRASGGKTSPEAARVWRALARSFHSEGSDPKTMAIAIR